MDYTDIIVKHMKDGSVRLEFGMEGELQSSTVVYVFKKAFEKMLVRENQRAV